MFKTTVGDVYDVVSEGRRVRVVDRRNGAVPVDFTAPRDAPPGLGDAIKQALATDSDDGSSSVSDSESTESEVKKKTKKRSRERSRDDTKSL